MFGGLSIREWNDNELAFLFLLDSDKCRVEFFK